MRPRQLKRAAIRGDAWGGPGEAWALQVSWCACRVKRIPCPWPSACWSLLAVKNIEGLVWASRRQVQRHGWCGGIGGGAERLCGLERSESPCARADAAWACNTVESKQTKVIQCWWCTVWSNSVDMLLIQCWWRAAWLNSDGVLCDPLLMACCVIHYWWCTMWSNTDVMLLIQCWCCTVWLNADDVLLIQCWWCTVCDPILMMHCMIQYRWCNVWSITDDMVLIYYW